MLFASSTVLILILIAVSAALPKREKTSVPQTAMIGSAQNSNAEPAAKVPEPTVNAVFEANSESTQTAESAALKANVEPVQTAESAALEANVAPVQTAESAALEANVEPAQTAEFASAGFTSEPTYSPPPADTEILITAVGDCTLGGDNEYGSSITRSLVASCKKHITPISSSTNCASPPTSLNSQPISGMHVKIPNSAPTRIEQIHKSKP